MKRCFIVFLLFVFCESIANSQTISFVMFDNIKAYEKNGGVQIEWTNLTERDLYGYIIEHSTDGVSFDTLQYQQPLNNHNDKSDYIIYDDSPEAGNNFYRIRVSGTAGRSITSTVLKVVIEKKQQAFNVYPNPVTGNQLSLTISLKRPGNLSVRVYDITGNPVFQKSIFYQGRFMTQTLQLPPSLKAGNYVLVVSDGEEEERRVFIKR